MAAYAEWHWMCDVDDCTEGSEEPFGDEYSADTAFADHLREEHPGVLEARMARDESR